MQNLDNNNIEQLVIAFYIINYLNGDFNYKKILNTTNQANRFEILNLLENYIDDAISYRKKVIYSNDKLTKCLQKSVSKRIFENFDIERQNLIKNKMLLDIRNKLSSLFKVENITILNGSISIQNILIAHLYEKNGEVKFSTNDDSLFSKVPDNGDIKFINTDKDFDENENSIYYIPNLKKSLINLVNKSSFIIDIKNTKHNIENFRFTNLNFVDDFSSNLDIDEIGKIWCTLLYLGESSLFN